MGGMSLLDASLAISGHEASEEEFLTKYIFAVTLTKLLIAGQAEWLVAVWFINSEEM